MILAERLYRLLLHLYPLDYRREYGDLMLTHFRDLLRDAHHTGPWAVLRLWGRVLLDLLTTIPAEHMEIAMHELSQPLPWRKALLAALPGLGLLVIYLLRVYFLESTQVGLVYQAYRPALIFTLVAFLAESFVIERRLAVWALPALGYIVPQLLLNVWGLALFRVLIPALGLALIPTLGVLIWQTRKRGHAAARAWLLISLALALGLLGDLWFNPTALQQPGSAVLRQVFGIALLLVFVALGLPFARRYGVQAGLFLVAALYLVASYQLDPTYGLWDSIWGSVVSAVEMLTFLIIAPLLTLRARSERMRIATTLVPAAVGLAVGALVGPLVRGFDPWLQLVGAVQLLLTLAFALALYAHSGRSDAPTVIETHEPSLKEA